MAGVATALKFLLGRLLQRRGEPASVDNFPAFSDHARSSMEVTEHTTARAACSLVVKAERGSRGPTC
jgi:hypothetical protein